MGKRRLSSSASVRYWLRWLSFGASILISLSPSSTIQSSGSPIGTNRAAARHCSSTRTSCTADTCTSLMCQCPPTEGASLSPPARHMPAASIPTRTTSSVSTSARGSLRCTHTRTDPRSGCSSPHMRYKRHALWEEKFQGLPRTWLKRSGQRLQVSVGSLITWPPFCSVRRMKSRFKSVGVLSLFRGAWPLRVIPSRQLQLSRSSDCATYFDFITPTRRCRTVSGNTQRLSSSLDPS